MIFVITDKCSMNCSHCLSDCKEDGKHITMEQFEKNLEYAMKFVTFQPILLSGGEPFEHPNIKEILEAMVKKVSKYPTGMIYVLTNGSILAKDKSLYNWYREFAKKHPKHLGIQISNDERYYPEKLTDKEKYYLGKLSHSWIFDEINGGLYPQGRALDIPDATYVTRGPKCTNGRSVAKQGNFMMGLGGFVELYRYISQGTISAGSPKLCTPRLNIDGTLSLGESRLCPPVGSIEDDDKELFNKVMNFRCSKCTYSMNVLKEETYPIWQLINN